MGDALKNARAVIAVHAQETALRQQSRHRSLLQGLGFGLLYNVAIGVGNQYGRNRAGEYRQIVTAVAGKNRVSVIKALTPALKIPQHEIWWTSAGNTSMRPIDAASSTL